MILASVSGSITNAVANHGVYAVFGLMAIDAVFPAASELVMLFAGALAAGAVGSHGVSLFGAHIGTGILAFIVMALAGTLGYLLGALIGWWIGLRGGRPFLERRGGWFHLSPTKLDRAERWFDRWGNLGVLIGRITPVVRSFVSIPAGVFEMKLVPYTIYTAIGSAIWAFAIAGAGYGLGSNYDGFDKSFKCVEYAVVIAVVAIGAYLIYRLRAGGKVRRDGDSAR